MQYFEQIKPRRQRPRTAAVSTFPEAYGSRRATGGPEGREGDFLAELAEVLAHNDEVVRRELGRLGIHDTAE